MCLAHDAEARARVAALKTLAFAALGGGEAANESLTRYEHLLRPWTEATDRTVPERLSPAEAYKRAFPDADFDDPAFQAKVAASVARILDPNYHTD